MSNCYLQVDDVRNYIWDRNVEDNDLELDLTFSDEEIIEAMKRCAREYASIPPYVGSVSPGHLPNDTNMFLDGTVAQLYISRLNQLSRNDIDYAAGGVQTNLVKKQIEHMRQLAREHMQRFKEPAMQYKITLNLRNAFGRFT